MTGFTGDDVRDVVLLRSSIGYNPADIDELLATVAAGLDAGHAVGPRIAAATVGPMYGTGYDIDAVDWLLSELQREEREERDAEDPWRDLPVVNLLSRRALDEAPDLRGTRARKLKMHRLLQEQCASAWRDFREVPGTHLTYNEGRRSGGDLCAAGQQPLASVRGAGRKKEISSGGRVVTFRRAHEELQLLEVAEEIAGRLHLDHYGHFAAQRPKLPRGLKTRLQDIRVAVDEPGSPVLYISGIHVDRRADTRITFPDGRWLRFPVRGTGRGDAIMTAVDETGKRVARYRYTGKDTEIIVHPGRQLTDELALVIAATEELVRGYFASSD